MDVFTTSPRRLIERSAAAPWITVFRQPRFGPFCVDCSIGLFEPQNHEKQPLEQRFFTNGTRIGDSWELGPVFIHLPIDILSPGQ